MNLAAARGSEGNWIEVKRFLRLDCSASGSRPLVQPAVRVASFFIENKRSDVVNYDKARQINDHTNGHEDERNPNRQGHRLPRLR